MVDKSYKIDYKNEAPDVVSGSLADAMAVAEMKKHSVPERIMELVRSPGGGLVPGKTVKEYHRKTIHPLPEGTYASDYGQGGMKGIIREIYPLDKKYIIQYDEPYGGFRLIDWHSAHPVKSNPGAPYPGDLGDIADGMVNKYPNEPKKAIAELQADSVLKSSLGVDNEQITSAVHDAYLIHDPKYRAFFMTALSKMKNPPEAVEVMSGILVGTGLGLLGYVIYKKIKE